MKTAAQRLPNPKDYEKRAVSLIRKHNGISISGGSGKLNIEIFIRVIWKIAVGFFWLTDPFSLSHSSAISDAIGSGPLMCQIKHEDNNRLLFADMSSEMRLPTLSFEAGARIYSLEEEMHTYIYCEIDMFGGFGFPIYRCRIPNAHGNPIEAKYFGASGTE